MTVRGGGGSGPGAGNVYAAQGYGGGQGPQQPGYGGGPGGYGGGPGGYGGGPGGYGGAPPGQPARGPDNRNKIIAAIVGGVVLIAAALGAFLLLGGGNEAEEYVTELCPEIEEFQTAAAVPQQELEQIAPETLIEDAQPIIDSALAETIAAMDEFINDVEDIEPPDVEGGEEVQDTLIDGANALKSTMEASRAEFAAVAPDDSAGFQTAATNFQNNVQAQVDQFDQAFDDVEAPEIEEAGEEAEACEGITN